MGIWYAKHMRRAVKNSMKARVELINAIGIETTGIKGDAALHAVIRVLIRTERELEDLIARAEGGEPSTVSTATAGSDRRRSCRPDRKRPMTGHS